MPSTNDIKGAGNSAKDLSKLKGNWRRIIKADFPTKIPQWKAMLMIGLAIILDLLSAVPILNLATLIVAAIIFFIWFYINGYNLKKDPKKKVITHIVSMVVEAIPLSGWIPAISVDVCLSIAMKRLEDLEKHESEQENQQKMAQQAMSARANQIQSIEETLAAKQAQQAEGSAPREKEGSTARPPHVFKDMVPDSKGSNQSNQAA